MDNYHETGINVKDHTSFRVNTGALPEKQVEHIYEDHREMFWADARTLAEEAGYADVFAEGRSGGWLVPQPEVDHDDRHSAWKFEAFKREIENLLDLYIDGYATAIQEARQELEREIEADKSIN